jgi:hypothetical protein
VGTDVGALDELGEGDLVIRTMETPDVGSLVTLPDGTEVTPDVAWLIGLIVVTAMSALAIGSA